VSKYKNNNNNKNKNNNYLKPYMCGAYTGACIGLQKETPSLIEIATRVTNEFRKAFV